MTTLGKLLRIQCQWLAATAASRDMQSYLLIAQCFTHKLLVATE